MSFAFPVVEVADLQPIDSRRALVRLTFEGRVEVVETNKSTVEKAEQHLSNASFTVTPETGQSTKGPNYRLGGLSLKPGDELVRQARERWGLTHHRFHSLYLDQYILAVHGWRVQQWRQTGQCSHDGRVGQHVCEAVEVLVRPAPANLPPALANPVEALPGEAVAVPQKDDEPDLAAHQESTPSAEAVNSTPEQEESPEGGADETEGDDDDSVEQDEEPEAEDEEHEDGQADEEPADEVPVRHTTKSPTEAATSRDEYMEQLLRRSTGTVAIKDTWPDGRERVILQGPTEEVCRLAAAAFARPQPARRGPIVPLLDVKQVGHWAIACGKLGITRLRLLKRFGPTSWATSNDITKELEFPQYEEAYRDLTTGGRLKKHLDKAGYDFAKLVHATNRGQSPVKDAYGEHIWVATKRTTISAPTKPSTASIQANNPKE